MQSRQTSYDRNWSNQHIQVWLLALDLSKRYTLDVCIYVWSTFAIGPWDYRVWVSLFVRSFDSGFGVQISLRIEPWVYSRAWYRWQKNAVANDLSRVSVLSFLTYFWIHSNILICWTSLCSSGEHFLRPSIVSYEPFPFCTLLLISQVSTFWTSIV